LVNETVHRDVIEQVTINSLEEFKELVFNERDGRLLVLLHPYPQFYFIRQVLYWNKNTCEFIDMTFDEELDEYIKNKVKMFLKPKVFSFHDPIGIKVDI